MLHYKISACFGTENYKGMLFGSNPKRQSKACIIWFQINLKTGKYNQFLFNLTRNIIPQRHRFLHLREGNMVVIRIWGECDKDSNWCPCYASEVSEYEKYTTSIVHWIKNPLRRTSERNHTYTYLNFSFFH